MSVAGASGQLALIGLLQFVPLFLLTPFSGLAADRFDRRDLARLTILLQFGCAAVLAFLTWHDAIRLHWLYAVAVVLGSCARSTALPFRRWRRTSSRRRSCPMRSR